MKNVDVSVIGAGPAGLAASVVAARAGAKVALVDENSRPGGQLFKQIHKFFGSREHRAGTRGMRIGRELLDDTFNAGVDVMLNSTVWGLDGYQLGVTTSNGQDTIIARRIVIATGAGENPLRFSGWTLPGVMTAGGAQTMMNLHRVLPGHRVLMVGSGNVGLIVSYQLLQAGAEVVALIEASPRIGGYFVHAAKLARAQVPILTSHTIKCAHGEDQVTQATIVGVDENWGEVPNTESTLDVDLICIAVGLSPQIELASMCGCEIDYSPALGGYLPLHDRNMETTVPGVYVAGDVSGVEEASAAMEEGRIAGISAAESLDLLTPAEAEKARAEAWSRLDEIRSGLFGARLYGAKDAILGRRGACGVR